MVPAIVFPTNARSPIRSSNLCRMNSLSNRLLFKKSSSPTTTVLPRLVPFARPCFRSNGSCERKPKVLAGAISCEKDDRLLDIVLSFIIGCVNSTE